MAQIPATVQIIVQIVIGINLLILVHELAHLIVARRNGVKVQIFSIGMGPPIFRWRWAQTEYRLSAIPIGGYVKLAGEMMGEDFTGAKDEFMSKTRWQRFKVFISGSLMNIALAFPLCIIAFLIGREVPSTRIGNVAHPEALAGMIPGDRIIEVEGRPIQSLDQYQREILARYKGTPIKVKVQRNGTQLELTVIQQGSIHHKQMMPTSNIIAAVEPGSVAQRAGLKPGDRILQIDDKPVFTVQDIQELIRDSQGKRLRLTIQRAQRLHTLYLTPEIETVYELPMDTRLLEARVGKIIEFFPAGGVLQRGDLIKKVNGTKISCWKDLKDAITKLAGKDARLQIDRGGQILNLKVRVAKIGREGKGMLGIEAMPSKVFALVKEGLYYTQGLRSGDILRAIDGTIGDIYVSDLFGRLRLTREPSSVKLEVLRGQEVIPIELPRQLCTYGKPIGIVLEIDRFYRYWGLKEAIIEGLLEPIELSMLTFQFIYKLFAREESPKMLAGPIGIVHISVRAAEAGLGTFLWLLALITISLGILNLLPIPALDGGFILLLLFETIKGKPLSQRFASGFVTLGWILVLMLLVYVCYNDILRLFSRTF